MGCCASTEFLSETDEILSLINERRARHGCVPLKLDKDLCKMATNRAKRILQESNESTYTFTNDETYKGERIGQCVQWTSWTSTDPRLLESKTVDCPKLVDEWYKEVDRPGYNYFSPKNSPSTRGFTNMVWKSTTDIGIGIAKSLTEEKVRFFVVINYFPAGSTGSSQDFVNNVPRPIISR